MIAIAKPVAAVIHLPRWVIPSFSFAAHRRKRATIDLIHSSPHLLRDIGVCTDHVSEKMR